MQKVSWHRLTCQHSQETDVHKTFSSINVLIVMEYGGNTYGEHLFIHILNDYTYNFMYTEYSSKIVLLTEFPSVITD